MKKQQKLKRKSPPFLKSVKKQKAIHFHEQYITEQPEVNRVGHSNVY